MDLKYCNGCGMKKLLSEFFRRRGRKNGDGLASRCKDCASASAVRWRKAHPERVRELNGIAVHRHRRRHLNMSYCRRMGLQFTEADFQAMWISQDHKCAICGQRPTPFNKKRFPIDHDHATGQIRAIVCHKCNLLVGILEKDPGLVQKAQAYIRHHARKESVSSISA